MIITEKIKNKIKYFNFFKRILKHGFKKRYIENAPPTNYAVRNNNNNKQSGRIQNAYVRLVVIILFPIILMLLSSLIFSSVFSETIENYPLFFFCGEIIFLFLFVASPSAVNALTENMRYIRSIYLPKNLFVLASVILSAVPLVLHMVISLLIMLFTSAPFSPALFMLPVLALLMLMFSFGFSLILAAYSSAVKRFDIFYMIFSFIWLTASPVFYPTEAMPEKIRFIFNINPAVHYMKIMRTICCYGEMPSKTDLERAAVYSVLVMLLGISVFKAHENSLFLNAEKHGKER